MGEGYMRDPQMHARMAGLIRGARQRVEGPDKSSERRPGLFESSRLAKQALKGMNETAPDVSAPQDLSEMPNPPRSLIRNSG